MSFGEQSAAADRRLHATAGARISQLRGYSGKQPGYPVRAAYAILKARNPSHHLLLGNAAYHLAMAKLDVLRQEFSAWAAVLSVADFPKKSCDGSNEDASENHRLPLQERISSFTTLSAIPRG